MRWLLTLCVSFGFFILLIYLARLYFRRGVRRQLFEELRAREPEISILRETDHGFEIQLSEGGAPCVINLHNLYLSVASGPRDLETQRQAVCAFVTSMLAGFKEARLPVTLAEHGERLMPRLASLATVESAAAAGMPILQRATAVPDLFIVYVLDCELNVQYLNESRLSELGIDAEALHERSLTNLRRRSIAESVQSVVEGKQVAVVKLGDSYDAARLLLVPELLREGEELVAVIPDRETLALMPVPSAEGWPAVHKLARTPVSPYLLFDRPLRVSHDGFVVAYDCGRDS